jgi:ribonuclease P protein component
MKNLGQEESDFSFPSRKHRIRKYKDFKAFFENTGVINTGVLNTGVINTSVLNTSFGWVRFRENNLGYLRIAVSVSKKVSKKSTLRNRLRRICSELLRLKKNELKGYDIWVFIKTPVENMKDELNKAISKIHST